jgi:GNAT superfamily N-acetyltransferase
VAIEIASGRSVGELASLAPVVESVLGATDRPAGWFARKLRREAVDPDLTAVALEDGRPCGWVLVGNPARGLARTAGVGVLPEVRSQGVATRLLEAAARHAKAAGLGCLRSLAEPDRAGFFLARGFAARRTNHSLLSFAEGRVPDATPAREWDAVGDCRHTIASWMRFAWDHTPAHERSTLVRRDAIAHVSREGAAFLVQKLATRSSHEGTIVGTARHLLGMLPAPSPVVLYGCNAVSSVTSSLEHAGWSVAQTAVVLERAL